MGVMSKSVLAILVGLALVYPIGLSADEFVVNTGPGERWDGSGIYGYAVGSDLGDPDRQWLAGEFVVDKPLTLRSAQAWLWVLESGNLEVAILSDGGEVPGTVLYSAKEYLNAGVWTRWMGPKNLNWYLEPGTYWFSIGDVRSSLPAGSIHAGASYPSVKPLENGAVWKAYSGSWQASDNLDFGVQIIAATDDPGRPVCWEVTGHCYESITAPGITWHEARAAAENLSFEGRNGHLATITSQAEQDFINTAVLPPAEQGSAVGETRTWLGGFKPGNREPFEWITGEPFDYNAWRPGEPSGEDSNNYLEFYWGQVDWNDTANFDPGIDGFLMEYPATFGHIRALGDINGDGSQDIVALERKNGTLTATIKDVTNRNRINVIRFDGRLVPVDLEVMPDTNGNGAPELVVLGTGSTRSEVRDSLTGEKLTTVDFDPNLSPIDLELLTDQTGNGVPELAMLGQGSMKVEVKDPVTNQLVKRMYFNNYIPKDLSVWNRGNNVSVGVLAESKDPTRGDKVEIRDLATGQIIKHLWVGKPWNLLQMELVADLNGNGAPELAILREHPDDNWVSVQTMDTASGSRFRRLGFDPNYRPVRLRVLDDLNGNGSEEAAVLAVRRGCCNQKVWVKDTLTGETIRIVYFGKQYIGEDMDIIPDINGNGTPELVVLGRRDDGKIAAIIKDSKTAEFISWVGF
jgi:hypothetical protein